MNRRACQDHGGRDRESEKQVDLQGVERGMGQCCRDKWKNE